MNKYPKRRWVEFSFVKMQVRKNLKNLNSPKYVTYTMQQEFQIWLAYLNINQRLFCIKRPIFSISLFKAVQLTTATETKFRRLRNIKLFITMGEWCWICLDLKVHKCIKDEMFQCFNLHACNNMIGFTTIQRPDILFVTKINTHW